MKITNEILVRAINGEGEELVVIWDIMEQNAQLLVDDPDGPTLSVKGGRNTLNKLHRTLRGTPNIGDSVVLTPLVDGEDSSAEIEETKDGFRVLMTARGEWGEKSFSMTRAEANQLSMAIRISFTLEGPSI